MSSAPTNSEHAPTPPPRLLRARVVCERTGLSRTTLWRPERRGASRAIARSPRMPWAGWKRK
jgi:predicted DNA-binding transcriptional regulator AlpA